MKLRKTRHSQRTQVESQLASEEKRKENISSKKKERSTNARKDCPSDTPGDTFLQVYRQLKAVDQAVFVPSSFSSSAVSSFTHQRE